jgi:hypothetical protein
MKNFKEFQDDLNESMLDEAKVKFHKMMTWDYSDPKEMRSAIKATSDKQLAGSTREFQIRSIAAAMKRHKLGSNYEGV